MDHQLDLDGVQDWNVEAVRDPYHGGLNLLDRLMIYLEDLFNVQEFPQPGLRCHNVPLLHRGDLEIPELGPLVDIEQVGEHVYWSYTVPDELEGSISFKSSEKPRETHIKNKYKIRHEFVAETFSVQDTDVRLDEIFTPLDDEDDCITPDLYACSVARVHHIIEIGTSRSPTEVGLIRMFNEKLFKYEMPIRNRVHDEIVIYTAIVVGVNGVISNHQLPEDIVNELIVRMNIAMALENIAKGKGITITSEDSDTPQTRMAAEILECVGRIGAPSLLTGFKLGITPEYMNSCLEEPDVAKVVTNFKASVSRTQERLLNQPDELSTAREYIKKQEELGGRRSDMKPITVMPLFVTPSSSDDINIKFVAITGTDHNAELSTMWSSAFSAVNTIFKFKQESPDKLLKEAYLTNPSEIKKVEAERRAQRNKWHRVNMKGVLNGKTIAYLRRDGLFCKNAGSEPWIKQRKKEQKKPFWWSTPVNDIEDFFEDTSLLDEYEEGVIKSYEEVLELLDLADHIAENDITARQFLEPWLKTKLFQGLDIMSDIAHELAASLKQNTESNEFILKKLRHRDVYLLIKPTNSRSHMFYSILVPKSTGMNESHPGVFRRFRDLGTAWATDFCSVKASKVENLANASSHMISMVSFWSEYYSLDDCTPAAFKNHKEAFRMLTISLSVLLEDKACTEEIITLSRYMYMEIFKGQTNIGKPNPFKMLPKMPELLRSRLSVVFLKRIIQNFSSMVVNPPKRVTVTRGNTVEEEEDAPPDDAWSGLLNCLTGSEIPSASKAINLMYIGYFKNKNQEAEGNSEWSMVDKILEEEFDLDENEKDKSLGELGAGEKPGKKQFDKQSIMHGCKILETRLSKIYGREWKKVLEIEIANALSKHLTHEIATLKASSTCDHTKVNEKASMKSEAKLWRVKVIEAIASKLGMTGLNPMLHIEKILEFVEHYSGGVICDLFKKNQHGGLREIYVLTIESRLLQLFLETISRVICSHFPEETLTHPGNKMKILDNHKTRAAREARKNMSVFGDLCSSSDKTRWNQNFVMPAMSIPLFRFTTLKFHNAIARILNLWANKLILIPPTVLNLLVKRTQLSSKTYAELLRKFWGRFENCKNKNGMRDMTLKYLNLTTGMMQGILHFTSSLLHLAFLASSKALVLSYMKKKYPQKTFIMSQVCSSDDSATILSVITNRGENELEINDARAFYEADLMLETLTDFCGYYCMRESVKSSTSVYNYVEFNSEFLLKNTLAIPVIKFVAACLNLTESSSFIQRFQNMYNLISDLRGSGMSSLSTYYCQVAQAWQHYKVMGANMSPLFYTYRRSLLLTPSPVHGFFLLDNQLLTGVLGYSFCRWLLYQNNKEEMMRLKKLSMTELEVTHDGGIVESLSIKHGDLRRWHTLMDRVESGNLKPRRFSYAKEKDSERITVNKELVEEREKLVSSDPDLFFRHPENIEELKLKLLIKASMPGVADSLTKGNPFLQALSLSVYCLFSHSFTQTSVKAQWDSDSHSVKKEKNVKRLSLLLSLKNHASSAARYEDDEIPPNLLEELFPLQSRYITALEVIRSFRGAIPIPSGRRRTRINTIVIQPRLSQLPLTLLQVVARLWYGHSVKCSGRVYSRCLASYRDLYPWLENSFNHTLRESPFSKPLELYNFLAAQTLRHRKFKYYGPALNSNKFIGQVVQVIRRTFRKRYTLTRDAVDTCTPESMDKMTSEVSLSLMIPLGGIRKKRVNGALKRISDNIQEPEEIIGLGKRDTLIGMIALLKEKRIQEELVPHYLSQLNQGIIVTFTKVQQRIQVGDRFDWRGPGRAIVLADGIQMAIEMMDEFAVSISVRNFTRLRQQPSTMRQVFERLMIKCSTLYSPPRPCEARFNGHNFVSSSGTGTPIYVDPDIEDIYFDPPKMVFLASYGRCGIYQTVKNELVQVLEFRTNPRDVSLYNEGKESSSMWDAWTKTCKLKTDSAMAVLWKALHTKPGVEMPYETFQDYRDWMRDTLKARLKFRNIGFSDFSYARSIEIEEDEADQDLDDEIAKLLEEVNTGALKDDGSALFKTYTSMIVDQAQRVVDEDLMRAGDDNPDEEGPSFSELLQFSEELTPFRHILCNVTQEESDLHRAVESREYLNYYYLHPLWDDVINEIQRAEPRFFYQMLQGVVSATNSELSRNFMDLFGIKEKSTEATITERFAAEAGRMNPNLLEDSLDDDESDHEAEALSDNTA